MNAGQLKDRMDGIKIYIKKKKKKKKTVPDKIGSNDLHQNYFYNYANIVGHI